METTLRRMSSGISCIYHTPSHKPESPESAAAHDAADLKCIMNYDHDGLHLCGACALRLRGWARFQEKGMLGFSAAAADQPSGPTPAAVDPSAGGFFTQIYNDFA